jgi:predicted exporter
VLTSVISYLSLVGTGFNGLTQLAIFCVIGLLVAVLVTKTLLPQWINELWIQNRRYINIWQPLNFKLKVFLSIVVVLLPLNFLLQQENIFSENIYDINPATKAQLKTEQKLRKALNLNITDFLLFEGNSVEDVLLKTQKIQPFLQTAKNQNIISSFKIANDILPSQALQKQRLSLLPNKASLQKNISKASENLKFKKDIFKAFINEVVDTKNLSLLGVQEINKFLPNINLKSQLFQYNNRWYSLVSMNVQNKNAFKHWLNTLPNADKNHISTKNSSSILMKEYLTTAWQRLLLLLGLISVIVFWQMRHHRHKFWILVPIFSGVFVTLFFQILLGHTINIFHVLSLLLVVGLGFDYGLFFTQTWQNIQELEKRTHAIIISAISTSAIFITLGFSQVTILAGMGQIIAVGVLTCFIVARLISVPKVKKTVLNNIGNQYVAS